MRRITTIFAALFLLVATLTAPAAQAAAAALSSRTHLFYYPWYGNDSGGYRHWQQGGHTPPDDIGANFYPVLGPYDSGDLTGAVEQHMRWIEQSGAGVLVYSWWGQGSYEDGLAAGVLEAAARHGIRVAWHLEPYNGRTASSTVSDIDYLLSRYGSSPAFYREGGRGAFYVFESLRITDWTALDQVRSSAIVLAQTTDTSKVAHFGGMYTYDAIAGATAPGWREAGAYCEANGLVWAPSVGPGLQRRPGGAGQHHTDAFPGQRGDLRPRMAERAFHAGGLGLGDVVQRVARRLDHRAGSVFAAAVRVRDVRGCLWDFGRGFGDRLSGPDALLGFAARFAFGESGAGQGRRPRAGRRAGSRRATLSTGMRRATGKARTTRSRRR